MKIVSRLKYKSNEKRGITLIALVITIIVLLILAGVSIATLTGNNGVLTQASNAKIEMEYASVRESIGIAVNEFKIAKNVGETNRGFLDWLYMVGYINEYNIINVEGLLGKTLSTGNGTGNIDVYKIENQTTISKIASTLKLSLDMDRNDSGIYNVVYYNKERNSKNTNNY